jgi:hypothetical protein
VEEGERRVEQGAKTRWKASLDRIRHAAKKKFERLDTVVRVGRRKVQCRELTAERLKDVHVLESGADDSAGTFWEKNDRVTNELLHLDLEIDGYGLLGPKEVQEATFLFARFASTLDKVLEI